MKYLMKQIQNIVNVAIEAAEAYKWKPKSLIDYISHKMVKLRKSIYRTVEI